MTEAEIIEMIDIGGPSMLRGAAKNFAHVRAGLPARAVRPRARGAARERRALARDAPRASRPRRSRSPPPTTPRSRRWFAAREEFPDPLVVSLDKVHDLALRREPAPARRVLRGARRRAATCSRASSSCTGRELSYNNLTDLSTARALVREFAQPACVIVKHANPCGVAVAATIEEAYDRALAADPISAFGCVVVLNRPVEAPLGERHRRAVRRGLFAPEYDDDALDALQAGSRTLRILRDRERRADTPGERDYKRVVGGLLVQERDAEVEDRDGWQVVTGALDEAQWDDLVFAWRVCKHVARTRSCSPRTCRRSGSAPAR